MKLRLDQIANMIIAAHLIHFILHYSLSGLVVENLVILTRYIWCVHSATITGILLTRLA